MARSLRQRHGDGFGLDGVAELVDNIEAAAGVVASGGADGLRIVAEQARDLAATKAPVDEGELAASLTGGEGAIADGGIRFRHTRRGEWAEIGTSVLHGRFQENGTEKMRARRYLRPAVYAVRRSAADTIGHGIRVKLGRGFFKARSKRR